MSDLTVTIEIWGDFALWTRPESKVERMTYPVPTPSGIRGVLASIYSKPPEFYWQVKRIEVLKPIRYISFKRNEVKKKASLSKKNPSSMIVDYEEERTQRQSVVLQDVRYRITAEIVPRKECIKPPAALFNQFERRVKHGQTFVQPSMGTREFPAYFEWGSSGLPPIQESLDLGLMLYDVFDLHQWKVGKNAEPYVSLYRPQMVNGVIEVPPFDSPSVIKPGTKGGN